NVTHQAFAGLGDGDDTGRGLVASAIGDHGGCLALQDRHTGVRGPEVDANHTFHASKILESSDLGHPHGRAHAAPRPPEARVVWAKVRRPAPTKAGFLPEFSPAGAARCPT